MNFFSEHKAIFQSPDDQSWLLLTTVNIPQNVPSEVDSAFCMLASIAGDGGRCSDTDQVFVMSGGPKQVRAHAAEHVLHANVLHCLGEIYPDAHNKTGLLEATAGVTGPDPKDPNCHMVTMSLKGLDARSQAFLSTHDMVPVFEAGLSSTNRMLGIILDSDPASLGPFMEVLLALIPG